MNCTMRTREPSSTQDPRGHRDNIYKDPSRAEPVTNGVGVIKTREAGEQELKVLRS